MIKAFKLIWQCDNKNLILKLFYTLCTSLLPLVSLYVLKLLVDGVTEFAGIGSAGDRLLPEKLLLCLLAFCAIYLLNRLIGVLNTVNNDVLTQKLIDYINNLIQTQSVRLDMAYYDNPDYHDTFHRAQQEAAFRPIRILENVVAVFGASISMIGVAAMFAVTSWQVIVVMIIAVIPTFFVRLYKSRRIYRFRRETTQNMRRSVYYGQLLSNRNYAKEVRSFGLASYFRERYLSIRRDLVTRLLRISRRLAVYDALTSVFETVALGAVLLFLVRPTVMGALSIGSFVMLFEAFRRGQSYLNNLVGGVGGLYEHKLFINNLFEFLELKPSIINPDNPKSFPKSIERIDFDDVTFSYPDMKHPTLSHFSLSAKFGTITRITGENGFGKTTLLKLLLRLYDPQSGAVRINGIDIRCFDVGELRHNISAIFQDYVQFYFTAKENITFGDINNADDASRLAEAIRLADAQSVVDSLGNGLDTPLGRQFDNGEELSMGQWQRIALARQLYSNAPILIFDEPTAWMDAPARANFKNTLESLKNDHLIFLISHIDE